MLENMFGCSLVTKLCSILLMEADFNFANKTIYSGRMLDNVRVPKQSVSTMIRRQEWEKLWKHAKEDTSSSMSGLHLGNYKARDQSKIISHFHALKTSLLLCRGIALDRWSHGLSVMLKKMFGCSLVTKLRSILIMEEDFNFANKTIYGGRMLDNVKKYNLMPEEIFSEQNRMADDRTLAKVLFYDIIRQLRVSAGISSAMQAWPELAVPILAQVRICRLDCYD